MIPDSTIQQISAKIRLSEVASSYFPVKKRAGRFVALCPFHNERSPSLFISDERSNYKCFGCGAAGSAFRFIMEMERVSFPESVRILGKIADVSVDEESSEKEKLLTELSRAVKDASGYFTSSLMTDNAVSCREQLKARGFNRSICKDWGVGYAPHNYKPELTEANIKSGIIYPDGRPRFTDRIVFEVMNETGQLVGFSGRTLVEHSAKYLNSPDSPLFSKKGILYALDKAKREIIKSDQIVVVEGQIDAIRCHLHGIKNCVAPLGTAFTQKHGEIIRRLCSKAILVFDDDKAGREATRKAYAILAPLGVEVRCVNLKGQDPDEFILNGGDLSSLISSSRLYAESLSDSLNMSSPENRKESISKIAFALSLMDDEIGRDEIIRGVCQKSKISVGELRKQISMNGGHPLIPTSAPSPHKSESLRQILAHLLQCGKDNASHFDWVLVNEPDIQKIIESDYIVGDPSSIARVLSGMDESIESAVSGISCEEVKSIDIKSIYRSMLEAEIRHKAEEVASGKPISVLEPLLRAIKSL